MSCKHEKRLHRGSSTTPCLQQMSTFRPVLGRNGKFTLNKLYVHT